MQGKYKANRLKHYLNSLDIKLQLVFETQHSRTRQKSLIERDVTCGKTLAQE